MKLSNILVIIVSYNSMPWTDRCYNSLRNSTVPCDIITIDNCSTDGTPDYIRRCFPEVQLIEVGTNLGFGKANNIGLQKALDEGYDYIYLLNQDAWVKPDTFRNLIEIADKYPEYGILSPMQMQANEQNLDTKFTDWVIGHNQRYPPKIINDMFFGRLNDVYEVDFVMAAHWLITRKCLLMTGGFSPTFPHYGEDDNYIQRVQFWHQKVGIVPNSYAIHDRADRVESPEKEHYLEHYVEKLRMCSRPHNPNSVVSIVRHSFIQSFRGMDKALFHYTIRIYKERKQIKDNLQKSLSPCAFLKK